MSPTGHSWTDFHLTEPSLSLNWQGGLKILRVSASVFSIVCSTLHDLLNISPFIEAEMKDAGLLSEGEFHIYSPFARLCHTDHLPCRCYRAGAQDHENPGSIERVLYIISFCVYTTLVALRFELSILAPQCMDVVARQEKGSRTPSPVSPALTFASDTLPAHSHRLREDYILGTATNRNSATGRISSLHPSPKRVGRFAHIPVKSLRGVYETPLNGVWESVGPKIVELITTRELN